LRRFAWLSVSMPSVAQASMPSAFTPRTISRTLSNWGPSFTSRQAAPMQKRVAPAARALEAASSTEGTDMSFSACRPVSLW